MSFLVVVRVKRVVIVMNLLPKSYILLIMSSFFSIFLSSLFLPSVIPCQSLILSALTLFLMILLTLYLPYHMMFLFLPLPYLLLYSIFFIIILVGLGQLRLMQLMVFFMFLLPQMIPPCLLIRSSQHLLWLQILLYLTIQSVFVSPLNYQNFLILVILLHLLYF